MKPLNEIRDEGAESGDYREGESCSYYMNEIEAFKAGFDFAVKTLQERGVVNEALFVEAIIKWRLYWMNQTQNNQYDYENYHRRAMGVDANMKYHLAGLLQEAVNPILAARDARIKILEAQLGKAEGVLKRATSESNFTTRIAVAYFAEKKG